MKALIDPNGAVAQLEDTEFPVHEAWQWADAPAKVKPGWQFKSGEFTAPPPVIPVPPENTPPRVDDIIRALIAKGTLTRADITNAKKNR